MSAFPISCCRASVPRSTGNSADGVGNERLTARSSCLNKEIKNLSGISDASTLSVLPSFSRSYSLHHLILLILIVEVVVLGVLVLRHVYDENVLQDRPIQHNASSITSFNQIFREFSLPIREITSVAGRIVVVCALPLCSVSWRDQITTQTRSSIMWNV